MPTIFKRIVKALQSLSWQATILIAIATIIQGSALILSLRWGFMVGNLNPFYTVVAGTGWYTTVVMAILQWEKG